MLHVAYLRFKNCFSIHATVDLLIPIHIAIHRYVYQLMGVFCDRLELGSTAAHDYQPVKKAPIPTRLVVCSTLLSKLVFILLQISGRKAKKETSTTH